MTAEAFDQTFSIDVNKLTLNYERVAEGDVALGSPCTGTREMDSYAGLNMGVWEMTEGGMRDIEVDELFIVTAGRAVMIVHHPGRADESVPLAPGALVRLTAGMVTTWFVDEPLRKVYLIP